MYQRHFLVPCLWYRWLPSWRRTWCLFARGLLCFYKTSLIGCRSNPLADMLSGSDSGWSCIAMKIRRCFLSAGSNEIDCIAFGKVPLKGHSLLCMLSSFTFNGSCQCDYLHEAHGEGSEASDRQKSMRAASRTYTHDELGFVELD